MNLMNAVGKISDEHIAEFAHVSPKKFYVAPWMKITAAAACLAVIVTGVPLIGRAIHSRSAFSFPSNIITDCWADPDNENNARVVFNGITYLFDNDDLSRIPVQLNSYYELVGEVLTVDPENSQTDGFSLGCSVGDTIYMDPDCEDEIYVYTKSVTGDPGYVRFADCAMHEALDDFFRDFVPNIYSIIEYDNKLYYYYFDNIYSNTYELSDRYELVYSGDNGVEYYQDPDHTEEIYEYRYNLGADGYLYYRFIDYEACRQDGVIIHGRKGQIGAIFNNILKSKKTIGTESMIENINNFDDFPEGGVCGVLTPHVVINGEAYILNGHSSIDETFIDSLPEDYVLIGEVTCSGRENNGKEGFGAGFVVGNKIYQHPDKPEEVFVYTALMTGGERYWYVNCVKSKLPSMNSFDN